MTVHGGSLSVRLGWRLAAVMLVAIALAAGGVAWRAIATVHELDDSALQSQVRVIGARLPPEGDAASITLPDDLVAPFRASDGDNVFLIYQGSHLVATSDPAEAARLEPLLPHPLQLGFFRVPPSVARIHGMIGLAAYQGMRRVVVLQGREQSAVLLDSLAGNFLVAVIWLLLPLGLVTTGVGVWTIRRGLSPLRHVSAAAARVDPNQPGERLPTTALPSEVAPLVLAMNDALARLELALQAQRRFVAEAAHALRTPLAVLTARLDGVGDGETAEAVRLDVDRMARLVGQLLRMARLEGLPLDLTQPVDLRAAAVEAITALVPLALRDRIDLALLDGPSVILPHGNRPALVLAVANLIENALAHAPPNSTVEVVVGAPARVSVRDEGPGVALADRARIFERFERGPASHEAGAGLGLAIVAEIAAAHGGSACVTGRPGGGAAFHLVLHPGDSAASQWLECENENVEPSDSVWATSNAAA